VVIRGEQTAGIIAHAYRPDQLNLPDDPAFMPELDLSFDFSIFEIPLEGSGRSSLMSPPSLVSSRSSQQVEEDEEVEEPALQLPSGDTSLEVGFGGFGVALATGLSSVGRSESRGPGASVLEDESGILDVGWEFDEHGNMIETAPFPKPATIFPSADDIPVSRIGTDSAVSARVRREHAEGLQAAQQVSLSLEPSSCTDHFTDTAQGLHSDDGILAFAEDEQVLPEAQPFPSRPTGDQKEAAQPSIRTSPAQTIEEETPSTSVSAPHWRARGAKPLEFDDRPGLTNEELRQWNEDYAENMREVIDVRHPYKVAHQARKNAEYWVLGQGIGNVGRGLGRDHASAPLQVFCGASLLAALTGKEPLPAGMKHARSASVASIAEEEERRVRAREEETEQVGRGAGERDLTLAGQDEGIFLGGEEMVCRIHYCHETKDSDRFRRMLK
jgi:meiotic recombination protein REC8, fungi type